MGLVEVDLEQVQSVLQILWVLGLGLCRVEGLGRVVVEKLADGVPTG